MTDRALVRRFALLSALRWLPSGLTVAAGVLLLSARGFGLPTIGLLFTVHSVVVLCLELPTGGLADALGRRRVLVTSGMLHAGGLVTLAVGRDVPSLAAGFALVGVARALGSGPLDAWYVDAALAGDPDTDLTRGLSRGHVGEALGLGVGAVAGGLLPLLPTGLPGSGDGTLLRLSVPLLLAALLAIGFALAVTVLVHEPAGARPPGTVAGAVADVPAVIRTGVALGLGDRVLRRLLTRMTLVGIALAAVEIIFPARLAGLLDGPSDAAAVYGVFVTAGFFVVGGGHAMAPVLRRVVGSGPRTALLATVGLGGAVAALGSPALAAVAVAYLAFYFLLGCAGPVVADLLHRRVQGPQRATVLSVESLVLQLGGTLGTLALPAVAAGAGYPAAFWLAAVLLAVSALTLVRLPAGTPPRTSRAEAMPAVPV